MTEYTTSSQAYREYMSSRERTARWVQAHSPTKTQFSSPSTTPSVIDGLLPSSPPSEAGSSHSLPPQMVLRFPDGRPDVPIPYSSDYTSGTSQASSSKRVLRSQTLPQASHGHSRADSYGDHQPHPLHDQSPPGGPEEIRILPSRTQGDVPPTTQPSYQSRSKSLPRNAYSPSSQPTIKASSPSQPSHSTRRHLPLALPPPIHTPEPAPLQLPVVPTQGPQVTFDPHQPPPSSAWHPYAGKIPHARRHPPKHNHPPAIVYAPGHHSKSRYTPPAIFSHPPPRGPGGVVYSHSIPPPHPHYARAGSTPYPSAISSSHLSSVHEEEVSGRGRTRGTRHDRSRSVTLTGDLHDRPGSPSATSSTSSFASNDSGSTYYVLPSARQKVHIIAPEPSIFTATSTTKSPSSPKKPFFQRLFSFKEKLTSESSRASSRGGGRRLVRRHSTGGSGRGQSRSPP